MNCLGGAISKDIKGTIAPFLDEVDPLAEAVGSVNTVARVGNRLIGFNTDALGFEMAIREGTEGLALKTAVIYGYGGVASVVVTVLKNLGLQVVSRACCFGRLRSSRVSSSSSAAAAAAVHYRAPTGRSAHPSKGLECERVQPQGAPERP
jgi:shikimate 5-dehydrogenase